MLKKEIQPAQTNRFGCLVMRVQAENKGGCRNHEFDLVNAVLVSRSVNDRVCMERNSLKIFVGHPWTAAVPCCVPWCLVALCKHKQQVMSCKWS